MEETIAPVTEMPVERAVKAAVQTTAQMQQLQSIIQRESATTTATTAVTAVTATEALHAPIAPSVIPVEPMPSPVPGMPTPYHAVDFCVPVGPDFSLVTGLLIFQY